jgi:hypothetical protein
VNYGIFEWEFSCERHYFAKPQAMGLIQAFSALCTQIGDNRAALGRLLARLMQKASY